MTRPAFPNDEAFRCLRVGDIDGFQKATEGRDVIDLTGVDLRGTDFRRVNMSRLVLRDAYLKDADLRGCDLRQLDLEGASLRNAKVSGAYFPNNLSPQEIRLSVDFGTRLRTQSPLRSDARDGSPSS